MNISNPNLLYIPPKVAILDDDNELISDLTSCMDINIDLVGFNNVDKLISNINLQYNKFIKSLFHFFQCAQDKASKQTIHQSFQSIVNNPPFSVALVDLNIRQHHKDEGYEICELLIPYQTKTLIYSGSEFSELSLKLINQGVLSGQLNKSNDLFEELIPTIMGLHISFLNMHYNFSHLAILSGADFEYLNNIEGSTPSKNDHIPYIVYDQNFNFLTA